VSFLLNTSFKSFIVNFGVVESNIVQLPLLGGFIMEYTDSNLYTCKNVYWGDHSDQLPVLSYQKIAVDLRKKLLLEYIKLSAKVIVLKLGTF